jgi:hypothetical protein
LTTEKLTEFDLGAYDCEADLVAGWLNTGLTLDYLVNHLRVTAGSSDAYIAGYLSVYFDN